MKSEIVVIFSTSPQVDLYSYGIVLWEFGTRRVPFQDLPVSAVRGNCSGVARGRRGGGGWTILH